MTVEGSVLNLTNLDKVLYPETGFTKGDVIDYYVRIAPVLLPHLHDRPLTLKRYPDGVDGKFFYEKHCPSHRPDWVRTAAVWSRPQRANIDFCLVNDLPTLVWVGEPRRHRAAHVAVARRGRRAADDDGVRPRPGAARGHRRLLPGRAVAARPVRPARARVLREDLGLEGAPGVRAAERRRRHLRRHEAVRPARSPSCSRSSTRSRSCPA